MHTRKKEKFRKYLKVTYATKECLIKNSCMNSKHLGTFLILFFSLLSLKTLFGFLDPYAATQVSNIFYSPLHPSPLPFKYRLRHHD